MSAPLGSRQQIIDRIRAATHSAAEKGIPVKGTGFSPYIHNVKETGALAPEGSSWEAVPRVYVRRGKLSAEACIDLLIERLREYDAEVVSSTPADLSASISAQLAASGKHIFVAPQGLPAEWLVPGYDWKIDRGLSTAEIEKAEGVVTAASCGIADSGTIVLHHSSAEGRRVISLLPDWHLLILRASQVVETLPEYFDRCQQLPGLATYISGPSATADIEMTRIKGVHGPRFLHVILVRD